jgi:hypothetical protein
VQYVAVASQKFTVPIVIAVPLLCTVAVNVSTLPEATEVTGIPLEVTARVVVVVEGAAHACCTQPLRTINHTVELTNREGNLAFMTISVLCSSSAARSTTKSMG